MTGTPLMPGGGPALAAWRPWAFLCAHRGKLLNVFLWWSMAAALLLPALSQLGYPVWSLEYAVVALASLPAGVICFFASRLKFIGTLLLFALPVCAFQLYFGAAMLNLYLLCLLIIPGLLAFAGLVVYKPRVALRIGGFSAIAQIVATAPVTPAPTVLLVERDLPRQNVPSIIHLILDEHAGIAAFPENAVSRANVRRLEQIYLSRGFTVFRRAYSADQLTRFSVPRLFNPPTDRLPIAGNAAKFAFDMVKAEKLEQISERRALDLTFVDYMNFEPAIRQIDNVARARQYIGHGGVNAPGIRTMPAADRLWSAAAILRNWFKRRSQSPLANWFFHQTAWGRYWNGVLHPASWTNPLMGRAMLHELTARLKCCGRRGTYVFAHLIYPHGPLVFDEACTMRPSRAWLYATEHRAGIPDTLKSRAVRWRRHFEQAYCAGLDVARLVDGLQQRDELSDAVVIVHGDHGSRIGIEDFAERRIEGYDKAAYETDFRGTFFAVRIPGVLEGQVVERPVRIDDLYHHLVENDFRRLDHETLKLRADSPYAGWGAKTLENDQAALKDAREK